MFSKLFAFTALLLLALPALAQADGASLTSKNDKARLVVKLDSFADRDNLRITSVKARAQGGRWVLDRSRAKTWVSGWSMKASSLAGQRVTVYIQRRNQTRTQRTFLIPKPTETPNEPNNPGNNPVVEPTKPEVIPAGISADGLEPKWSRTVSDFTVLCPSNKVNFAVNDEAFISIDGQEAKSGSWRQTVNLSPGQETTITSAGQTQHVRCRPADMPMPKVEIYSEPKADFHLVAPTLGGGNYLMVIDKQGVPVWWHQDAAGTPLDFKVIDSSTFAWVRGVGPFSSLLGNSYDLRRLDGSLKSTVTPVGYGADHHDLQPTPDGGWLFIIYAPRDCPNTPSDCEDLSAWGGPSQANVIDGVIQKIDSDGKLVWEWNSRDHISLDESSPWIAANATRTTLPNGSAAYDIIHLNSVEPDGDGFIFSARHLDAVFRIKASGGQVDWKLGGVARPESLAVEGDPLGSDPLAGQHDARILADGSLTVHDNGTFASRPPRMVHYRLSAGKAELLGSISDPSRAPGSGCCGGGRLMGNGDWVVSWGANPVSAEYDGQGNPVMRLTWPGGLFSYRSVPATNGLLSLADLRQGMNDQFPR